MAMTLTEDIHDFFSVQIQQVMAGAIRLYGSFSRPRKHLFERLPNEILSYIFLIACESSSGEESDPVTLSHVCRRWGHVALSTGKIWTRIVLTYPCSPSQLSRALAFLDRSRQSPLDILIDLRDPDWDWEEDEYQSEWTELELILRSLLAHVHRWRRFELLNDTWSPIYHFLRSTAKDIKSAPMLESISLSRCNAYFATKLPNLTSVSLIGVHVDWSSSSLTNLSELELKYHASDVMPSFAQFKNILARCPNLCRLAIIGWGPVLPNATITSSMNSNTSPTPLESTTTTIHLPSVKTFSFGYIDTEYAQGLLSLLQFPSLDEMMLEDISYTVNPEDTRLDSSPVLAFLADSSSIPLRNLRLLSLIGIRSSRASLLTFYQSCENVVRLSVQYTCDDAVLALAPTISCPDSELDGDILPELQELYFEDMDVYDITYALKARADESSIKPLAKLSLDFVRPDTPSPPYILDQLSQFSKKTFIFSD
ncbi:hypothetical protein BDQ17DRAFT_1364403 [Cyathus striatus]|nr:hypothetical protein BDQ17DRAFT_1364403 [Cyathus striatus]